MKMVLSRMWKEEDAVLSFEVRLGNTGRLMAADVELL